MTDADRHPLDADEARRRLVEPGPGEDSSLESIYEVLDALAADDGGDLPTVREVLESAGVAAEDLDRAEAEGTISYLAIGELVLPDPPVYDLTEVSVATRMPEEQIVQVWRALGYPEVNPEDRTFTENDAELLSLVGAMVELDLLDDQMVVQLSRVIGFSLTRIAAAILDAIDVEDPVEDDEASASLAVYTRLLLPTMPRILDYVWRRHLQDEARRRLVREATGMGQSRAVGFADLVGYTALSQQLDEEDLAEVLERFETIAYDTVNRLGGRLVKMIGDEVFYVAEDARTGAEIALSLSESFSEDIALNDVRVGVAVGPVLEREGDVYGPVVNRASRQVGIAFPGTVVVDEGVHEALCEDEAFDFRSLKVRRLKDIGKVPLWSLRRPDTAPPLDARNVERRRIAERREEAIEELVERHVRRRGRRWRGDEGGDGGSADR